MSDTIIKSSLGDTDTQDYDRMAHIVLEGYTPDEGQPNAGEFVPVGTSVVEGIINGVPVKALCGKIWVPNRNPKHYPICQTCIEVAKSYGWNTPELF